MAEQGLTVNMYEFNKVNMAQIKPLDVVFLNKKCIEAAKEIAGINIKETYWMLLCRERSDYTIFHFKRCFTDLYEALCECLRNRGDVLDFVKRDDGSYEIWIRNKETQENFVYYLFDYTEAVIEV